MSRKVPCADEQMRRLSDMPMTHAVAAERLGLIRGLDQVTGAECVRAVQIPRAACNALGAVSRPAVLMSLWGKRHVPFQGLRNAPGSGEVLPPSITSASSPRRVDNPWDQRDANRRMSIGLLHNSLSSGSSDKSLTFILCHSLRAGSRAISTVLPSVLVIHTRCVEIPVSAGRSARA